MPQPFKRNFLQHALAVSQWMQEHDARGGIDPRTLGMEIALGGKAVRFYPQFVVQHADGGIGFSTQLRPDTSGFVGWLPYPGKVWPAAQDKIDFKRLAQRAGIRTPAWTTKRQDLKGAFLVKARKSTLGRGQRGPFFAPPPPAAQPEVVLQTGEYFEQFITGQLVKAWFWDGKPTVVEVVPMPTVKGDGRSTLRDLLTRGAAAGTTWETVHTLVVALWGLQPDSVPAHGQEVAVDYRYMSVLNPAIATDYNVAARIAGTDLETQLVQAGHACHADVPAELRSECAFSLDGVLDPDGRLHFLEINCNPLLHPAFYAPMLDALLRPPTDAS